MSRRGRPRAATPEQVEQVRSLAAEEVSERKIAEIVFGDAHYRGRVERILRPRSPSATRDSPGEPFPGKASNGVQTDEVEPPSTRELLEGYRRQLTSARDLPSLKEIELLFKLEREVEAQETLERLNALARDTR